jgi:hypothetical protein
VSTSMTCKAHIRFFAVRLFCQCLVTFFLLLVCDSFAATLRAQTIEIKIVDGRNGRPMTQKCMYVWVGRRSASTSGPLLQTQTDDDGVVVLHFTQTEEPGINSQSQQLACGLLGVINPTIKYGDTISIQSGYVLCQPHTPDYSWLATKEFSTKDVIQSGVVTANACGKATASPKPGEIILFVRPLTWWEKFKS